MKWIKDHIVEIIALLVSLASAITSIATGLEKAFRTEPLALLTWTVFLLVIGITAGWFFKGTIAAIASSGMKLLSTRQSVEYLKNQPDEFKEIICEALDNGGVYYEHFFDADMRILTSRGLFEAPDVHDAITECTWALTPKVIKLAKQHPESLMVSEETNTV